MTGSSGGTTTYQRKNMNSLIFETVGHISWSSNIVASAVYFGLEEVRFTMLMIPTHFVNELVARFLSRIFAR